MAEESVEALRKIAKRNQEQLRKDAEAEKVRTAKKREMLDKDVVDDEAVPQTPGRVGLVSPEQRQSVRQRVAEMDSLPQLATEVAPSITGAGVGGVVGGGIGALFGGVGAPVGAVAGATLGGLLGETAAQETGVAPESDVGLALSAAPIAGPVLGKMSKTIGRGVSTAVSSLPAVQSAIGKITMRRAAGEFESIGTQIIGNRVGQAAKDADTLYAAAKTFGAEVPIENFKGSLLHVRKLITDYREFPGMERAIIKAEKAIASIMDPKTKSLGMDDIMVLYKVTNEIADTASRTPGVSAQVSEDVFKMFDADIDKIANSRGFKITDKATGKSAKVFPTSEKSRRALALTQAAFKRSQLDRAVQTFERGVSKFTRQAPESADITLNVEEFRNWLGHATNPKSEMFDKNLTRELGRELPDIKKKLDAWTKLSHGALNPAGPGSLIVRNIGARTGAGVAGFFIGGPIGGSVGALMGARLPEGITGILMTPKGRALMDASLRLGKGSISQTRWALLAQVATQASVRAPAQAVEAAFAGMEEE